MWPCSLRAPPSSHQTLLHEGSQFENQKYLAKGRRNHTLVKGWGGGNTSDKNWHQIEHCKNLILEAWENSGTILPQASIATCITFSNTIWQWVSWVNEISFFVYFFSDIVLWISVWSTQGSLYHHPSCPVWYSCSGMWTLLMKYVPRKSHNPISSYTFPNKLIRNSLWFCRAWPVDVV